MQRLPQRHPAQWFLLLTCVAAVVLLAAGSPIRVVTTGAVLAAIGIGVLAAPTTSIRELLSRGLAVEVFGFKTTIPAAAVASPEEQDEPARNLVELRLKLDQKMTYLAKHVLGTPSSPACLAFGSMAADGQLGRDTAEVCAAISALRVPGDSDRAAGQSLADWLELAQRTVSTLRVEVVMRTARTSLSDVRVDDAPAFHVEDADIASLPRAFRVRSAYDPHRTLLVVPVFSRPPNGRIYLATTVRLEGRDEEHLVVCPPLPTKGVADTRYDDHVARLPGLVEAVRARVLDGQAPEPPQ